MSYGRHADFNPCWRCGSDRSRRMNLSPRPHTTHHDRCDCQVGYSECVDLSACKRRRSNRAVAAS